MEPAETPTDKQMSSATRVSVVSAALSWPQVRGPSTSAPPSVSGVWSARTLPRSVGEARRERGRSRTAAGANGPAGASAQREYERRRNKREARIRTRHPKIGELILALSDDPQSTKAGLGRQGRGRGGSEARQASIGVDRGSARPAHRPGLTSTTSSCRLPGFRGQREALRRQVPELRVEGGILRPRVEKLLVGKRDRTKLVDGVLAQVDRLCRALEDMDVPVVGVLCFVNADWPLIGGSLKVRGVRVVSPRRLSRIIDKAGERSTWSRPGRLAAAFPRA